MALACRQARELSLATVAGHARESERLQLESHISSCVRCGEEHGALSLLRALREVPSDVVGPAGRRHIRQTLAAGQARVALPPRQALWPFGFAAASAAAVALLAVLALRAPSYRILAGDVAVTNASHAPWSVFTPTKRVSFRATEGGSLGVGDATAELARDTEVTWVASERAMTLGKGSVTVDVQHQVGRRFQVRTARFIVEVVGTRFTVDPHGVRTQRGVVRVLRLDGTEVSRVEAGQSWREDGVATASRATPVTAPASAGTRAATAAPRVVSSAPPVRVLAMTAASRATAGDASASGLAARLVEARHLLSRGDAITARRLVAPLFRQGRDLAVEARVLFAESFLVEGRYADAVDGYRVVARDFPRSDQAETSLFAIAQLETEHGRAADARSALRAYAARYPRGRFVKEVADRLNRLPSGE